MIIQCTYVLYVYVCTGLHTDTLAVQTVSEPTSEQSTVNEMLETSAVMEGEPPVPQLSVTQGVETEGTDAGQPSSHSPDENVRPQDTASMTASNPSVGCLLPDSERRLWCLFCLLSVTVSTNQSVFV